MHLKQHLILEALMAHVYVYVGINLGSKVCYLNAGIKTTQLNAGRTHIISDEGRGPPHGFLLLRNPLQGFREAVCADHTRAYDNRA